MQSIVRSSRPCTFVLASLLFAAAHARADVIQVPADVATIQGAIDLTVAGDTVLVAPGLYAETLRFPSGRPITVRSSHGAAVTTVDSVGSYVLFMCGDMGPDTVLQGFTLVGHTSITPVGLGSTAPLLLDCAWTPMRDIFIDIASPVFINCRFTDGSQGEFVDVWDCAPEFVNCTFANNARSFLVWDIRPINPEPRLRNCILLGDDQIHEGGDGTPFASLQNCLIGPDTCVGFSCGDPTNVVTTAPLLDAEHRPLPGSPAVDLGSNAWLPRWVRTDWSGARRHAYGVASCEQDPVVDAGASELQTVLCDGTGYAYCATTPNSVDPVGARMGYVGSLFVSDGDLTLTAAPVPASFGMFFFGEGATLAPMGEGVLCVSGRAYRLPPVQASSVTLRAEWALDFGDPTSSASRLLGGSTWYFQYWYRDVHPQGPSSTGIDPSHGFRFSDGLKVNFGA